MDVVAFPKSSSGPVCAVPVRAARVNDKRTDPATGERKRFASAILPAWARKSPRIAEVFPRSHNFSDMFIATLDDRVRARADGSAAGDRPLFTAIAFLAAVLYRFNLFRMELANLAMLFLNLLWFAYSIGLFILGIVVRLGTRSQALAWGRS
jgi:hypothetical protein